MLSSLFFQNRPIHLGNLCHWLTKAIATSVFNPGSAHHSPYPHVQDEKWLYCTSLFISFLACKHLLFPRLSELLLSISPALLIFDRSDCLLGVCLLRTTQCSMMAMPCLSGEPASQRSPDLWYPTSPCHQIRIISHPSQPIPIGGRARISNLPWCFFILLLCPAVELRGSTGWEGIVGRMRWSHCTHNHLCEFGLQEVCSFFMQMIVLSASDGTHVTLVSNHLADYH